MSLRTSPAAIVSRALPSVRNAPSPSRLGPASDVLTRIDVKLDRPGDISAPDLDCPADGPAPPTGGGATPSVPPLHPPAPRNPTRRASPVSSSWYEDAYWRRRGPRRRPAGPTFSSVWYRIHRYPESPNGQDRPVPSDRSGGRRGRALDSAQGIRANGDDRRANNRRTWAC